MKIILYASITLNVILMLVLAFYLTPIARYKYYGSSTRGEFYRINRFTGKIDYHSGYTNGWRAFKSR